MNFLNFVLIYGAAAAAVPLLIHLFNRSRARVVPWAAMHLLLPAVRKTRRKIRLEQLLLMLVRAAILAALALCMARPVLTGWKALAGEAPASAVLLLDNSYSMEAGSATQTNFQEAREGALHILQTLRPGSEVAAYTIGGGVRPLAAQVNLDLPRLAKALASVEASYGVADIPAALETAAAAFVNLHHAQRDLILISDFQRLNWTEEQAPALQRIAAILAQMPVKPNVVFLRAGAAAIDNVAVESLELSPPVIGVGQSLRVRAGLRNFGEVPYVDLRVSFRVDGRERNQTRLSLGPGERGQVLFAQTFETPGSHLVEVSADADRLKADNALTAAVQVVDRLPVLLVNGEPSRQPLRGATDFLQLALQPTGNKQGRLADLLQPRVIGPRELTPPALSASRVVVLANVRQLEENQVRALEAFVRDGGGLLIFPGGGTEAAWYNAALPGLLPARLAGAAAGAPATLISQHFNHPALEMFNDPRNGNLAETEIRRWWKLAVPSESSEKTPDQGRAAVLARLDNGDAFLVERSVGRGGVILAASGCDAQWSDMPLRPFYLPLMQQLVVYAAARATPPRNLQVGQPLIALLPLEDAGKPAILTGPDAAAHELPVAAQGAHGLVEFRDTQRPGLYTLRAPGGSIAHFVVNTSRQESDLRQLRDNELQKIADTFGGSVIHSWREYAQLDQTRRFGREIWRPLFWSVLALLLLEMLLQQWITRRKP